MRYFTDDNNVVWSFEAIKDYFNHLIETEQLNIKTTSFGKWFGESLEKEKFIEMKVCDYDRITENDTNPVIDLLYVDQHELPSVLTAMIKQELYKWSCNNNVNHDADNDHVKAEIAKLERLGKCLYKLLNVLDTMFSVKVDTMGAYNIAVDCDIDSTTIGSVDDYIEEETGTIICCIEELLKRMVPGFNPEGIGEEWFYDGSPYIPILMEWCSNLDIKME